MDNHTVYLVYAKIKSDLDTLARSFHPHVPAGTPTDNDFVSFVYDNIIFAREFLAIAFENAPAVLSCSTNAYTERCAFHYYMELAENALQTAFTILDTQIVGQHPFSDTFIDLMQYVASVSDAVRSLHLSFLQ
jgi:hypothetical protein